MSLETPHAQLQGSLRRLNQVRMTPSIASDDVHALLREETALRRLEIDFVTEERRAVREQAANAPRDVSGFLAWFRALEEQGPGQNDALFPWLEHTASLQQMIWFLGQEAAGEAGFDDLVALAQLRLPARAKMEMARNYWDEMGRGKMSGMHGPMLEALLEALNIDPDDLDIVWQSRALGNLMCALASNRAYAYQAIGALGVIELTAPRRAAAVNAGLKRLNVPVEGRRYYAIHATLDVHHANAWIDEVFAPLVAEDSRFAPYLAEGALMRLNAGARVFEAYRQHLRPRHVELREALDDASAGRLQAC